MLPSPVTPMFHAVEIFRALVPTALHEVLADDQLSRFVRPTVGLFGHHQWRHQLDPDAPSDSVEQASARRRSGEVELLAGKHRKDVAGVARNRQDLNFEAFLSEIPSVQGDVHARFGASPGEPSLSLTGGVSGSAEYAAPPDGVVTPAAPLGAPRGRFLLKCPGRSQPPRAAALCGDATGLPTAAPGGGAPPTGPLVLPLPQAAASSASTRTITAPRATGRRYHLVYPRRTIRSRAAHLLPADTLRRSGRCPTCRTAALACVAP